MALEAKKIDISFGLQALSTHRKSMMGIATVLILIAHAAGGGAILSPIMKYITKISNVGVDIFLFFSGLGMFYSLEKFRKEKKQTTDGRGIASWYAKRFTRLLVPWCLIAVPYYFIEWLVFNQSIGRLLLNITTLSYWVFHAGAWFVAAIIPLYLIIPIYGLSERRNWLKLVIVCVIIVLFCTLMPVKGDPHSFWENIRFVMYRLPIFFLGYTVAPYVKANRKINGFVILLGGAILTTIIYFILPRMFLFNLIAIPVILVSCILLEYLVWLRFIFSFFGEISLESYLLNILLPGAFRMASLNFGKFNYLVICFIGLILAIAFNRIGGIIVKKLSIR